MPQEGRTGISDSYAPNWKDAQELQTTMRRIDAMNIVIDVEVEIPKINGVTPAVMFYAAAVRAVFGNLPMGFVAVRNIAGTSTWSQHAYGNAVDVMCEGDLHRQIAYWSDSNRGVFNIAHLLADPYFPSPLGDHYNHVHMDPYPQWGGTPPGHPI